MPILDAIRGLQRETGLARAAGARQRDEPSRGQELDQLEQLSLAADERGGRRRQMSRAARRAGQGRERRRDAVGDSLMETYRPDDVAQSMRSQVEQRDVRCKLRNEPNGRIRDDDLPSMRDGEHSRRLMESHPEQ